MWVHNLNGTSQHKCKCANWLQHWANVSGRKLPKDCSKKGCTNGAAVGAHVQKKRGNDCWYIVPLCRSCNQGGDKDFEIQESVLLVSANAQGTCARA